MSLCLYGTEVEVVDDDVIAEQAGAEEQAAAAAQNPKGPGEARGERGASARARAWSCEGMRTG